jgi:hypothetical protein
VAGERKYSAPLEALLREVKGAYADDEIARDLDPKYVELNLRYGLFSFVPKEAFSSRRLLDFGCGAGASAMVLKRLVPDLNVVGVDRDAAPRARGGSPRLLQATPGSSRPMRRVRCRRPALRLRPPERGVGAPAAGGARIFEELFGRPW